MREREVIWVTGATSGLGAALSRQLADAGHKVIASGRNQERLRQLVIDCPTIEPLAFDVTDEAHLEDVAQVLYSITSRLDRVILNAGNCEYLDFPSPDWSATARMMGVNFFGVINCVQLALPLMGPGSQLVAVASLATAAPFPRAEAYGASKAALQYFCDSLRLDLASRQIRVTVVNPGFIDTPLTQTNNFSMPFIMSSARAADRIIQHGFSASRSYSFPRRLVWVLKLSRWFPGLWQRWVAPKQDFHGEKNAMRNGDRP